MISGFPIEVLCLFNITIYSLLPRQKEMNKYG
jgi:hypothetical protein